MKVNLDNIGFSAEFWRWFGDSKVRGVDGEPLLLYHGTTFKFSEFKAKKKSHLGFHFGTAKAASEKLRADANPSEGRDRKRARYLVPEVKRDAIRDRVFRRQRQIEDERAKINHKVSDRDPPTDWAAFEAAVEQDRLVAYLDAHPRAQPNVKEQAVLDSLEAEFIALRAELDAAFAWGVPTARILAVYLAIDNPVEMNDCNWGNPQKIREANRWVSGFTLEEIRGELDELRYDGIVYTNCVEDRGSTSYVALYPSQVRIVTT